MEEQHMNGLRNDYDLPQERNPNYQYNNGHNISLNNPMQSQDTRPTRQRGRSQEASEDSSRNVRQYVGMGDRTQQVPGRNPPATSAGRNQSGISRTRNPEGIVRELSPRRRRPYRFSNQPQAVNNNMHIGPSRSTELVNPAVNNNVTSSQEALNTGAHDTHDSGEPTMSTSRSVNNRGGVRSQNGRMLHTTDNSLQHVDQRSFQNAITRFVQEQLANRRSRHLTHHSSVEPPRRGRLVNEGPRNIPASAQTDTRAASQSPFNRNAALRLSHPERTRQVNEVLAMRLQRRANSVRGSRGSRREEAVNLCGKK